MSVHRVEHLRQTYHPKHSYSATHFYATSVFSDPKSRSLTTWCLDGCGVRLDASPALSQAEQHSTPSLHLIISCGCNTGCDLHPICIPITVLLFHDCLHLHPYLHLLYTFTQETDFFVEVDAGALRSISRFWIVLFKTCARTCSNPFSKIKKGIIKYKAFEHEMSWDHKLHTYFLLLAHKMDARQAEWSLHIHFLPHEYLRRGPLWLPLPWPVCLDLHLTG